MIGQDERLARNNPQQRSALLHIGPLTDTIRRLYFKRPEPGKPGQFEQPIPRDEENEHGCQCGGVYRRQFSK